MITTHTHAAEGIIAAMLLDPSLIPDIGRHVKRERFHHDDQRMLFSAIVDVYVATADVDIRSLRNRLEQLDQLEAVGGLNRIAHIDLSLPNLDYINEYVAAFKKLPNDTA